MPGSQPVSIRLAVADDLPAMAALLAALFALEHEFAPDPGKQIAGLQATLDDPRVGQLLVAELDRQVVGVVNLLWIVSTAIGGPAAILEDFVVDPARRGHGIGSRLLDEAVRVATEAGRGRLALLTDHDNAPAQRIYERHGFVRSTMLAMSRPLP
ncbi:MAG: GNAT family N-acetyltransferase [Planctomycetota bacterium]